MVTTSSFTKVRSLYQKIKITQLKKLIITVSNNMKTLKYQNKTLKKLDKDTLNCWCNYLDSKGIIYTVC